MTRRTLIVAPWLPLPADFGGALRTFHLTRELAKTQDITFLAPTAGDEHQAILELGGICDVVAVPARWTTKQPPSRSKRLLQARSVISRRSFLEAATLALRLQPVIDRLFLTREFDIVQFEMTQMALYTPPTPRAVVINTQNNEHDLLRRVATGTNSTVSATLKFAEARKVRALERRLWATADQCVATSARDADVMSMHSGLPAIVVPNGVDTAAFARPRDVRRRPHHVVFTGAMRHAPNADAARWYVENIHPRVQQRVPDATVALVGADPPASVLRLASASVQVTGRVEDIRPMIWEAAVAVVPLRSGGGTRLKIVEAFAAETPVVSTTIGAEGIAANTGEHLLLADAPERFAAEVVGLMRDPAYAAHLTTSALTLAHQQYDWAAISKQLIVAQDYALERFRARASAPDGTQPIDWGGRLWPGVAGGPKR